MFHSEYIYVHELKINNWEIFNMLIKNKNKKTIFLTVILSLIISVFGSAQDEITDLKFKQPSVSDEEKS